MLLALFFVSALGHDAFLAGKGCFGESDATALTSMYGFTHEQVQELEARLSPIILRVDNALQRHADFNAETLQIGQVLGNMGLFTDNADSRMLEADFSGVTTVEQYCQLLLRALQPAVQSPEAFLGARGFSHPSEFLQASLRAQSPYSPPDALLSMSSNSKRAAPAKNFRLRAMALPLTQISMQPVATTPAIDDYFSRLERTPKFGRYPYSRFRVVTGQLSPAMESIDFGTRPSNRGREYPPVSLAFDGTLVEQRGEQFFTWYADRDDGSSLTLVALDGEVVGTLIDSEGHIYRVSSQEALGDGSVTLALTRFNPVGFPEEPEDDATQTTAPTTTTSTRGGLVQVAEAEAAEQQLPGDGWDPSPEPLQPCDTDYGPPPKYGYIAGGEHQPACSKGVKSGTRCPVQCYRSSHNGLQGHCHDGKWQHVECNDNSPEIFVTIGYSSTALSKVGGTMAKMTAFLQLMITESNQGMANSNLNVKYLLANSFQTQKVSTTMTTNDALNSWYASAEAAAERAKYGTDLLIYLTNLSDFCGKAKAIGADATTAYVVVDVDCATGYFSTGHEMGHLYGARHNTEEDSNTDPFAYGHGFHISLAARLRTIMAYDLDGATDDTSLTRINYWSSKTNTYNGHALGDTKTRDNARVINERWKDLDAFGVDECFGGESVVHVLGEDGQSAIPTKMSDLRVGQKVAAMDESANALVWSEVIAWLDRKPTYTAPLLHIEFGQAHLPVTPHHVVFRTTPGGSWEAVEAKDIVVGDRLLRFVAGVMEVVVVDGVSIASTTGLFTPLTAHGNLVVNGVLASSFANINHQFAQVAFKTPMLAAHTLGLLPEHHIGEHPFALWAKELFAWAPHYVHSQFSYTSH